jgi:CMP-N,N'-diacetyllegionaminic acid synthase
VIRGKTVLAIVPARSGSKGIPDKNLQHLGGISLIARAGEILRQIPFIEARVISTDSREYADEGRLHGLDAPFLRPALLSGDEAGAVETVQHALAACETHYGTRFDIVLIVEPTSPLRTAADIEQTVQSMLAAGADSAVTVSRLPTKFHPLKLLAASEDGRLRYFHEAGDRITGRQQLPKGLLWRNGVCYAVSRECLLEKQAIITDNTVAVVIERDVVNIDEPFELALADLLIGRQAES